MVNRLRDDTRGVTSPIMMVQSVVGRLSSLVIALYIMASIQPLLTLVAIAPTFANILVIRALSARIRTRWQESREMTSRFTGLLGELLGGVQALKVAATEEHAVNHLDRKSESRRRAGLSATALDAAMTAVNGATITLTTGALMVASAQLMREGSFTVGDFALFMTYVGQRSVFSSSDAIGWAIVQYKRTKVALERLFDLLPPASRQSLVDNRPLYFDRELPSVAPPARSTGSKLDRLAVRDLSYRYPESGRGIVDISLELDRGSFTVVTGRIGAGKTTLLEVLLGLLPRDEGEILWNGERVEDPGEFLVPPLCAYTPQVPRLFSDTLRNNILLGLPEDEVDLPGALRLSVMEQDVAQLDHGLDTVIGPRGVKLSGGQGQRTAAARMFVRAPDLMVFDDLSSALDVETEKKLWGPPVRDGGAHLPGSLPSARRTAPCRPCRRTQGGQGRGGGEAERAVGIQRRDAEAVERRDMRTSYMPLLVVFLCLFVPVCSWGEDVSESSVERRVVNALRTEERILIDGHLSEKDWERAEKAKDFFRAESNRGILAGLKTEAMVLYDDATLYVGFRCFEPDMTRLRETLTRRDTRIWDNDAVEVVLDTYDDDRNGYIFGVNTLGTQMDQHVSNESVFTMTWDARWGSPSGKGRGFLDRRIRHTVLRAALLNRQFDVGDQFLARPSHRWGGLFLVRYGGKVRPDFRVR